MTTGLPARARALDALTARAAGCTRCPKLAQTRTQVVVGTVPAQARLLLVGEAPDAAEDREGVPFTGAAGQLMDRLLAEIGLSRAQVGMLHLLRCHPPANRSPLPGELENCQEYLHGQVELTEAVVVCPLGTFATRRLRGDHALITAVHGREEVRVVGARAVRLYPLLHPVAALYATENLELLRADMARIPALLALGPPEQPEPEPEPEPPVPAAATVSDPAPEDPQLGLF